MCSNVLSHSFAQLATQSLPSLQQILDSTVVLTIPRSPQAQSALVSFQVTGKCGSVTVRLIPAPRGTGIVAAGVSKKLLQMAGVDDCYTSACGTTATVGNFGKWNI